ncbi:MAG: cell division protein FtsZ [Spirochaetia bacterium]
MSSLKLKVVDEQTQSPVGRTVIKVIGAGGGGCNALNHMISAQLQGVEFIAVNTDVQALEACLAPTRIALGRDLTGGLGAGGNPDIGARAAQEDRALLEQYIDGAHMVFLTTGLGGGTGTGSLPVIAEIAKKSSALTVAIVTLPFSVEGSRKMDVARDGLEDLRKHTDALIVVPNEKLLTTSDRKMRVTDAFGQANELLRIGVEGIVELINHTGYINVDFADVKTIMSFQGEAIMGQGVGRGDNRALDALKEALSCPLAENTEIDGAKGLLVNVTAGDDLAISEYDEIMSALAERIDPNAVRKMGLCINPNVHDEVRVTVIATGFVREKTKPLSVTGRLRAAQSQEGKLSAKANSEIESLQSIPSSENLFGSQQSSPIREHALPSGGRSGLISSDAWEKLTSGRRSQPPKELDESIPSYLRIQGDSK